MRVAIALLAALTGCLTEDVETSESDQDLDYYFPIVCTAGYQFSARGRSVVWRYTYSNCSTTAWTTWVTSPSVDSYATLTNSTGGYSWTSAPACDYHGSKVQRGDVTCWPSDTHWMAKCSTTGVFTWEYRATQYCIQPGSSNTNGVIGRPGVPLWAGTPNIHTATVYERETDNPSPVAAALDQSRVWGADCRATAECPMTGYCASYELYRLSDGAYLGSSGAKCRDSNELYHQDQDPNYIYDRKLWDRYGDNVAGGTW